MTNGHKDPPTSIEIRLVSGSQHKFGEKQPRPSIIETRVRSLRGYLSHLGEGFAFALLLGGTTYSPAAYCARSGADPVFWAVVFASETLIIAGIVAFAEKNAAENREKRKQSAIVSINGSWDHRRRPLTWRMLRAEGSLALDHSSSERVRMKQLPGTR
jgi:hypothetical protein